MIKFRPFLVAVTIALGTTSPAFSQSGAEGDSLQYADIADLSVDAPVIAVVTVKRAIKVDPERALNAPAGTRRYYVEAMTDALIRGQGGIPDMIRYVVDLPINERGRVEKIKNKSYILFGRKSGNQGVIQLIAPDAQLAWSPARDQRVRQLVREVVTRGAPPRVTGIGSAFHVPGTIIGEGETQIFMDTATGDPVSITVLSRDGQRKIWAVSLSEIVDEAARAPVRNSLLWYRLACFLPRSLPEEALTGDSPANANQARRDYQLVIQDLGNCPRSRPAEYWQP